jgi:hypothetical protein
MLLAVLVTFGLLQRSNEITAIKATGISLYRVIVPVLIAAALVAGVLFLSDQLYLPYTNKRQDALRNRIKGKPAQTYLRPRPRGFSASTDIYYINSSIPTAMSSVASPCSSSTRILSRSRTVSPPTVRTGRTPWAGGFTSRVGSEA